MIRELHLLSDGFFGIDLGFLVYGKYHGDLYKAALKPLLIIADDERILVDTGMGELPAKARGFYKRWHTPTLEDSLRERGYSPEDITMVINTHLHLDHCGNNHLFGAARFYVQERELRYAFNPHRFQKGGYVRAQFDVAHYETLDGDVELVDGIEVLTTPGHTPGHQSVVLEVEGAERHSYVYCGDAAPLRENLAKRNIVGILYNPVHALNSIDKLKRLGGTYIYSHDNEQLSL